MRTIAFFEIKNALLIIVLLIGILFASFARHPDDPEYRNGKHLQ